MNWWKNVQKVETIPWRVIFTKINQLKICESLIVKLVWKTKNRKTLKKSTQKNKGMEKNNSKKEKLHRKKYQNYKRKRLEL